MTTSPHGVREPAFEGGGGAITDRDKRTRAGSAFSVRVRPALTLPRVLGDGSAPADSRSGQLPERVGGLTLQLGVPVRGGHGVRRAEKVPGPLEIAGGVALDEHRGPPEVGLGAEELRTSPYAERCGAR